MLQMANANKQVASKSVRFWTDMNWAKLNISLFTLLLLWAVIGLNYFLESDAETKQQVVTKNWTSMEIILTRQCRATWPLKGDEYDACIAKIKEVYREDI